MDRLFDQVFYVDAAPVEFTGRGQLERLCPRPARGWVGVVLRTVGRLGAWRQTVAWNPRRVMTLARWGYNEGVVAGLGVAIAVSGAAALHLLWLSPGTSTMFWGLCGTLGLLVPSALLVDGAIGALLTAVHVPDLPAYREAAAFYVALWCARWAPPRARAAWWRRVRQLSTPDHPVLASLLADHAADGGIPGLASDDLTPLLSCAHAEARVTIIAALHTARPTPAVSCTGAATTRTSRRVGAA